MERKRREAPPVNIHISIGEGGLKTARISRITVAGLLRPIEGGPVLVMLLSPAPAGARASPLCQILIAYSAGEASWLGGRSQDATNFLSVYFLRCLCQEVHGCSGWLLASF